MGENSQREGEFGEMPQSAPKWMVGSELRLNRRAWDSSRLCIQMRCPGSPVLACRVKRQADGGLQGMVSQLATEFGDRTNTTKFDWYSREAAG